MIPALRLDEAARIGPCTATIGNFDGPHLGHRHLFERTKEIARRLRLPAVALTFDPHPLRILAPERAPALLSTIDARLRVMEQHGLEAAVILPFTREFSMLGTREFAQQILHQALNVQAVVVGENFRFGHQHLGDIQTLQALGRELGFSVEAACLTRWRGHEVSSSAVRSHIAEGRIGLANRLLGRPFTVRGEVVRGRGIGSTQTVPTLNLLPGGELTPARGVYVSRTRDGERRWASITNIGVRPTFEGEGVTIETFLLEALEGEAPREIEVELHRYVRPERRFESAEALRGQILKDAARARRYWSLLVESRKQFLNA
jgi:riboflavin kinase/FMN adenylyltransferase